jgi:formimidoylglutamate deiminase
MQSVRAEWTWTGERFERDVTVEIAADGRISAIGEKLAGEAGELRNAALIPGFVNAHSHAFQRGLRGRGERFPAGSGSFWSWREAMYELVAELDADSFRLWTERCFREMRASGITSVGEFHYLHHSPGGDDFAFDRIVLEAAAAAGIRIALLNVFYQTGGFDKPLEPAQLRFRTGDPDSYWKQMEQLARHLDSDRQSLGVVAHSIRAVPLEQIIELHDESLHRHLVFHMHLEEQRREIDECVAHYGKPPSELLLDALQPGSSFTAVHATHTDARSMRRLLAAGAHICVTPTTEANLGDGIPQVEHLRMLPRQTALGSDSNARISPFEEMRWLEYAQRLVSETRGVFRDAGGEVARSLLASATIGGARSLDIDAGEISVGRWADFALLDLTHPALEGVSSDSLLDAIVFGASEELVLATAVGGRWVEHRTPWQRG